MFASLSEPRRQPPAATAPPSTPWHFPQVPPSDDGAPPRGYCRRIDAGGAVVLRRRAPLPAAGATLRLCLSGGAQGGSLESLAVAAGLGAAGERQGPSALPLTQLLAGGGLEGSVAVSSIAAGGGDAFDEIEVRRTDEGAEIVAICIDALAVAY